MSSQLTEQPVSRTYVRVLAAIGYRPTGIPHFDRLIPAAADDPLAVGSEGDAGNPPSVALEGQRLLARCRIP